MWLKTCKRQGFENKNAPLESISNPLCLPWLEDLVSIEPFWRFDAYCIEAVRPKMTKHYVDVLPQMGLSIHEPWDELGEEEIFWSVNGINFLSPTSYLFQANKILWMYDAFMSYKQTENAFLTLSAFNSIMLAMFCYVYSTKWLKPCHIPPDHNLVGNKFMYDIWSQGANATLQTVDNSKEN